MKLIRYDSSRLDPLANLDLRDEVGRLFDYAFPAFSRYARLAEAPVSFGATDLYQDRDNLVLRAEIPGFRKEDISLEVIDGTLVLTGHYRAPEPTGKEPKNGHPRQEKHFTRSFVLPAEVAVDKVKAVYENGVLTVTLPKREETKPRAITIEAK